MALPRPQRAMLPPIFGAGSTKGRFDGTRSCADRWRDAAVMPGGEAHVSHPAGIRANPGCHAQCRALDSMSSDSTVGWNAARRVDDGHVSIDVGSGTAS